MGQPNPARYHAPAGWLCKGTFTLDDLMTTRKRLSKTGSKQYFNQSLDYSSVTLQIAMKTFEL